MTIEYGFCAPLSRRGAMATGALVAATALPGMAMGKTLGEGSDDRLRSFDAQYVLANDQSVTGYFVIPRSHDPVDVVVMLPNAAGLTDELRARARAQARRGAMVIVPDLDATADPAVRAGGHCAMRADVAARIALFRHHPRSTGRLMVVAV